MVDELTVSTVEATAYTASFTSPVIRASKKLISVQVRILVFMIDPLPPALTLCRFQTRDH